MFLKKKVSLQFILDKIIGYNTNRTKDSDSFLRMTIHSINLYNSKLQLYQCVHYILSGYIRNNCIYLQVDTKSIDNSILYHIENNIFEKISCFRKNIKIKDFKVYCNQDQIL